MCKCKMMFGLLLLLAGVLFLLQDLGKWTFWGLNWYTVAFLMFGIKKLSCSCCKDCKVEAKKKK